MCVLCEIEVLDSWGDSPGFVGIAAIQIASERWTSSAEITRVLRPCRATRIRSLDRFHLVLVNSDCNRTLNGFDGNHQSALSVACGQ